MFQDQVWIRQDKNSIDILPNILSLFNYYKYHNKDLTNINLLDEKKVNDNEKQKINEDIKKLRIYLGKKFEI